MSSKVSFTVRRPPSSTPNSRSITSQSASPFSRPVDSSDEEIDENATELVTGFGKSGAQRLHERPKPSGPLVIAPLANRDWRAVARARKQQRFTPDGAIPSTGADGSQGGLGTRDAINSGPQAAGLKFHKVTMSVEVEEEIVASGDTVGNVEPRAEVAEDSEDERARKALLASVGGNDGAADTMTVDAIPVGDNASVRFPMDETDAYKQDVVTRPDSATLDDYERVPVSQFGAAIMRGMGWTEGTAASRTRRGMVEPWLPTSRPALLGIGAKERPSEEISPLGSGARTSKKPEKRYVPLVRLERENTSRPPSSRSRSCSPPPSGTGSRVGSKASSPYPSDKERRSTYHSRDRNSLEDLKYGKSRREKDSGREDRVRDRDRTRDKRESVPRERERHRHSDERNRRDNDRHDERESYRRERDGRY